MAWLGRPSGRVPTCDLCEPLGLLTGNGVDADLGYGVVVVSFVVFFGLCPFVVMVRYCVDGGINGLYRMVCDGCVVCSFVWDDGYWSWVGCSAADGGLDLCAGWALVG